MKTSTVLPGIGACPLLPRAGGAALTAVGPEGVSVIACDRTKKVQNKAVINTCALGKASRTENKSLLGFGDTGAAGKSSQVVLAQPHLPSRCWLEGLRGGGLRSSWAGEGGVARWRGVGGRPTFC